MGRRRTRTQMVSVNRNRVHRRALVESLESRRVLTSYVFDYVPPEQTPHDWAGDVLGAFRPNTGNPEIVDEIAPLESETAVRDVLTTWAVEMYGDLLGQELTSDLWSKYRRPYQTFDLFGTDWAFSFQQLPDRLPNIAQDEFRIEAGVANTASPQPRLALMRNLHEVGIGESDIIDVVDGYLFASHEGQVLIFDIRDAAAVEQVSSLHIGGGNVDLHVSQDRLIAVGVNQVTVFDVTDKSAPTRISTVELGGNLVSSRMIDGKLVLVSNAHSRMPPPMFIRADGLSAEPTSLGEEAIGRFETAEEYVERIQEFVISEVLPDLTIFDGNRNSVYSDDIGDWQDLAFGSDGWTSYNSNVIVIDVSGDTPQLLDGETMLGVTAENVYVDSDSIYLTASQFRVGDWGPDVFVILPGFAPFVTHTSIFHVDLDQDFEATADAVGTVNGRVNHERMLDEYEGNLRVVSGATSEEDLSYNTTNLYVLSASAGRLEEIGKLEDIAEGEAVFAVYFQGERAVITTAEMAGMVPLIDPLHGIDLSDPSHPVEVGELEIPGVATQLVPVGNSHLAGIGYFQHESGEWRQQVSLYDVSDLSAPKLIDNWTGENMVSPFFMFAVQNPLSVHFDTASNTLLVPVHEASGWLDSGVGALAFRVDTSDNGGLVELGVIAPDEPVVRSFIMDEHVFALTATSLLVSSVDSPAENKYTYLARMFGRNDWYDIPAGEELNLNVLENDVVGPGARIVSVSSSLLGAEVRISEDGQFIVYTAPDGKRGFDRLTYAVETNGKVRFESNAEVRVHRRQEPVDPEVQPRRYSDLTAQISVAATDDEGNVVTDVSVGDRIWLEFSVDLDGFMDRGVFQAVLNIQFDKTALEVVGPPEPVGKFVNSFVAVESETGFSELGGFSNSVTQLGSGPQTIVRFQVEAKQAGDFDVQALPSTGRGQEVLAYEQNYPLDPANVRDGLLSLNVVEPNMPGNGEATDVNSDGVTSAIDALMVVNFLNAEANAARLVSSGDGEPNPEQTAMDVNRDGMVTPLDVLSIVNHLNQQSLTRPEGESIEQLAKSGSSVAQQPVDDGRFIDELAAAHVSMWDLERRN